MKYRNILEPEGLVRYFLTEPPVKFTAVPVDAGDGQIPAFFLKFDLLTTLDQNIKKYLNFLKYLLPKPLTLFIGTTVSEYALFPEGADPRVIKESIIKKFDELGYPFLIVKDIPLESPLLSGPENLFSRELISELKSSKFIILSGEALAFVPVDFRTTDEYLQRFSRSRKKDFKRKLRSLSEISIEEVRTGSDFFDDKNVNMIYGLYHNVFKSSYVHFDLLTHSFFKKVLTDRNTNGVVILYKNLERVIGFNLCFIMNGMFIDKYIGFLYPESHRFNLYYISWFYNLEYCIREKLKYYIAGWSDPEVKAYLGAQFTFTYQAVYVRNPFLRYLLGKIKFLFESDKSVMDKI